MLRRVAITVVSGLTFLVALPVWAQQPGGEGDSLAAVQAAPIPEGAHGPAIPQDKGYLVEEIRDGLYWVTDGAYQIMFLTTGEGVILVDAPPQFGDKILAAIREVTDEPVTHLIYSHAHSDHIGAAGLLPGGIEIIAHEDAAELLGQLSDPNRPAPTLTFGDRHTLTVGSQTLELAYHGLNHDPGNVFIYAPRQKVLMVVDVFFPGWVPFKQLALSDFVPGFEAAHERALEYDFDTLVSGHLGRLGTRDDVAMQLELVRDLKAATGKALQAVDFMAIAQETGFENSWLLFGRYFDTVAARCAEEVTPRWTGRLGGADVFMLSHCSAMLHSFNTDYPRP